MNIFNIKQPRLVLQDYCPDFRQKKCRKLGQKCPDFIQCLKSGQSGNGTQLSCLKSKPVRIADIHCIYFCLTSKSGLGLMSSGAV